MPRKVFTAGEVLAAADVNTFLSNEVTLTSSGTSVTVAASDRYKTLVLDSASNTTVTFATTTAFEAGERVDILREGAGTVTIARSGTAVSFSGAGTAGTAYTMNQRFGAASVVCVAANSYRVIGNITAV